MLKLLKPKYEELVFRQELLSDKETMSYNAKWGGTIDFSPDRWRDWYEEWILNHNKCFYRYLYSEEKNAFIGEVAYHFDDEFQCYICDIIIKSCYRGQGFGKTGLMLLLQEAKKQGISVIYDNIAADNTAVKLFEKFGFIEKWRNEDFIMLEKHL